MAEKTPAKVQYQEIAMTAAQLASQNPVLLKGQIAVETDTLMVKVGNETSAYSARPYLQGGCPVGGMVFWCGTTIPSGYFPCDGRALSRTAYPSLYSVIGTTWGAGDGSTTFNIPNSYARFPQHVNSGLDGQPYYGSWNHYHYSGDFAIYAGRWNVDGRDLQVTRSFAYTASGASGAPYSYAFQSYSGPYPSTSSRYGGIRTRGNTSNKEGPYPKLNIFVLIKY